MKSQKMLELIKFCTDNQFKQLDSYEELDCIYSYTYQISNTEYRIDFDQSPNQFDIFFRKGYNFISFQKVFSDLGPELQKKFLFNLDVWLEADE